MVGSVDSEAYVEIERQRSPWRDRFRSYRVVIDGAEVGKLSPGATGRFGIPPGPHSICLKVDWCRSTELNFTAERGGTASFRCGVGGGSWRALYDATVGKDRYISLTPR
jgi:hypothetical protein